MKSIFFAGALLLISVAMHSTALSVYADHPRTASLVPGLHMARLPVELTNIDSVAYGPEGRLFAAGYDGRVHVLTDTDGDGLEDTAAIFWDKAGDLLTPVGILANEDGVYVAARGKIALLRDTDGDGRADTSETVASGWVKESYNGDTRNDAAGLAIDHAGNLFFSLGCMSYNKAWLLDSNGQSQYDPASERGTILKVSPDRKRREIVASGLRFVIGLDFNQHGDLFATDQEGDTWFPGGNPRDEFLHIIPGRHYGFPFRHADYLPDVIDEPYVVGFSPQHQSACGFRFNDDRKNRKRFGPKQWAGNAIVTGFSRGKLWRVPLAKTPAGYIGKQIQIAAFESLLTDVAISPAGDLLLTCHSGKPDWGAGPAANGHLYKITIDASKPQPVAAWPASPLEVKVAFDRPINPTKLALPQIEMGEFVWEGDQYEWIWPGYDVVKQAKQSLRRPLDVTAMRISDDLRTVTFTTMPHPWRSRYRIVLPGVSSSTDPEDGVGEAIEVSYDLGGAQATWTPAAQAMPEWEGWIPHINPNVIATVLAGSAQHERLLSLLNSSGKLQLKAQLVLPGKQVALRFASSNPFSVRCGQLKVNSNPVKQGFAATLSMESEQDAEVSEPRGGRQQVLTTDNVPLVVELETGAPAGQFAFDISYSADFDPYERPLRLEHLLVPWAPELQPPDNHHPQGRSGKVVSGDLENGRKLFFGKEANCASCHSYDGNGGNIAADLTVTKFRDPDAVMRDIIHPSDSINPDYVSYSVLTSDGRTLTGLFQSANERNITLIDGNSQPHEIDRREIDEIRASSVSLMPTGFEKLGKKNLNDLIAFLCAEDGDARRKGLPTGMILREHWRDVRGSGIRALKDLAAFPETPSDAELLPRFEGPINAQEYYGSRIRGYVHPPQTGDYIFWMAADDHAELWLSPDDSSSNKKRIIQLNRWTPSRDWDVYPEQQSKPIHLESGKRYYIEALHHEETADDCLAVGWQLPDETLERPIPGKRLSTDRSGQPATTD